MRDDLPNGRIPVPSDGVPVVEIIAAGELIRIADVADAVRIGVRLIRIEVPGAIVAGVTDAVFVEVGLARVLDIRAVVAGVADSIGIEEIFLIGIGYVGAVIDDIQDPVPVPVVDDFKIVPPNGARSRSEAGEAGLAVAVIALHRAAVGGKHCATFVRGEPGRVEGLRIQRTALDPA